MARPVYSTRFISSVVNAGSPSAVYTVPAGFVAVVKDVTAVCAITAPADGLIRDPGAAWLTAWSLASNLQEHHWSGMAVWGAGEDIEVFHFAGQFMVTVSGFLLTQP